MAKNALLVDDSRSARFVLGRLLKNHDFNVEMVDSAEAALDFLKSRHPDAIFMDYQMPGMSGLEAVEIIRGNPDTASIPVVMCSANEESVFLERIRHWPGVGVLPKPPTDENLVEVLELVERPVPASAVASNESLHAPAPVADDTPSIQELVSSQVQAALNENVLPLVERRMAVHSQVLAALVEQSMDKIQTDLESLEKAQPDSGWLKKLEKKINASLKHVEKRLYDQMDERLQEFRGELMMQVRSDGKLFAEVRKVAEGTAQMVSKDTASRVARETAGETAQDLVEGALEGPLNLMRADIQELERQLMQRTYLVAGVAALLGVVSGILAWFFA